VKVQFLATATVAAATALALTTPLSANKDIWPDEVRDAVGAAYSRICERQCGVPACPRGAFNAGTCVRPSANAAACFNRCKAQADVSRGMIPYPRYPSYYSPYNRSPY
jgi:hypothetical protein